MSEKLSCKHFHPYSLWVNDNSGAKFTNGKNKFIIDSSTNEKYLNEDLTVIRCKCLLLLIGTPIVHTIAAIIKIIFSLLKLISLYDFWKTIDTNNQEGDGSYNLKSRCFSAQSELFNIIFAPIAILLLEFSTLYGIIMPHDGRKLYANIERAMYGEWILAPCFHPEPTKHLLGGDIDTQNTI